MAYDAGSIEATLDLNRDPFNAGLDQAKRDVADFEADPANARLGADTSDLDAKVDEAKAKVDEFGDEHADATLGADEDPLDAKLAEAKAKLEAIQDKAYTAKVDANTTAARSKISAIQDAADHIDSELRFGDLDEDRVTKLSGDLDGLDSRLTHVNDTSNSTFRNASSDAESFGDSLSFPMKAAAALAPALTTIGAVGAGELAGLAGAAATAAAGIGAFALAAGPELSQVETQAKSMLSAFQTQEAPTVFPALQAGLALVEPALQLLQPLVSGAAGALTDLGQQADTALSSPAFEQFAQMLGGQVGPAIEAFGHLAGGAVDGLMGLDRAFRPLIADVESGLTRLGGKLAGAGSSPGLQAFIGYVQENAPEVEKVLGEVGTTIKDVVKGLADIGPGALPIVSGALDSINRVLGLVDDVLKYTSPEIKLAGDAFGAMLDPINSILHPLRTLEDGFHDVAGIFDGGARSTQNIGNALSALGPLAAQANGPLTTLGSTTSVYTQYQKTLATASSNASTALDQVNQAVQVLSGTEQGAVGANLTIQQALLSLTSGLKSSHDAWNANTTAGVSNQQAALSTAQAITQLIPVLAQNGDTTATITKQVDGYTASLNRTLIQAGLTQGQVKALDAQYGLTPKALTTEISTAGMSGAITDATTLRNTLAAIPAYKTITVDVSEQVQAAQQAKLNRLGHAAGTPSAPAGWAWVGEQGPELMHFSGGEQVLPHPASITYAAAVHPGGYADGIGGLSSVFAALAAGDTTVDVDLKGIPTGSSATAAPVIQVNYNPQYNLTGGGAFSSEQMDQIQQLQKAGHTDLLNRLTTLHQSYAGGN